MPARPHHRSGRRLSATLGLALATVGMSAGLGAAPASAASTSATSDVTISFGDQLKEYQTIVQATDTLKGARYRVSWSNFIGGPPIIAAEVGHSVDLGDMAETPTIFAQAAGDPVKVVAATEGVGKATPYSVVVPEGSPIKKASQLKGRTIAVQEGTVEQYVLIKVLQGAHIPYSGVTIDNLSLVAGEAALTSGRVDAWVASEPLTSLVEEQHKGRVIQSDAYEAKVLGYLTASDAALSNPAKAAAIEDFIVRLYKSGAILRKDPSLAARTYVKTYGVPLSVAEAAVKSAQTVPIPITSSLIKYQQTEANTFQRLGLISGKLSVGRIFDTSLDKRILAKVKVK